MVMWRGVDMDVQIDGALYSVKEVGVDDASALEDVTNTQGQPGTATNSVNENFIGFGSKIPGSRTARIRIRNATFDDNENPFASDNFALHAGQSLHTGGANGGIKIYVSAKTPVAPRWWFPGVIIRQMSHESRVPGLQPITITAESDGYYEDPGTTDKTTKYSG